jgi:hypothetical protein
LNETKETKLSVCTTEHISKSVAMATERAQTMPELIPDPAAEFRLSFMADNNARQY